MKVDKKEREDLIWLLIYTKAKQEIKANKNLKNQGFETFLPLIAKTNKNKGKEVLLPVFPRYFFVKINHKLDNWTAIKSSYGVSNVVMFGEGFTSVSPSIIKSIKAKLNEEGVYKKNISSLEYKKGDSLVIKDGKFSGIDAIFLSHKSKDRVRLLLKLLNTTVISEISRSDVGRKEIVKNFKF